MPISEYPETLGVGPEGGDGRTGGFTQLFDFETATAAPPSSGCVRLNNANPVSATHIYISETSRAGAALATLLAQLGVGDKIMIFQENSEATFAAFAITAISDAGAYLDLTVTSMGNHGTFENGVDVGFSVSFRGAIGLMGPTGLSGAAASQPFCGRIARASATILRLSRHSGMHYQVGSETLEIPSGGLDCTVGASGDNLISSTGTDSGSKTAANTEYRVYVSNSLASFAPSTMRLSSTEPSLIDGVKYLATSGNGANWRYIGRVALDESVSELVDTESRRYVSNYYNRVWRHLFLCPGRVNNDVRTTYSLTSATWTQANGASFLKFITEGEDAVHYGAQLKGTHGSTGGRVWLGVAEDGTHSPNGFPHVATSGQAYTAGADVSLYIGRTWDAPFAAGSGVRLLWMLIRTDSGTFTVHADEANETASVVGYDPAASFIHALVRQ